MTFIYCNACTSSLFAVNHVYGLLQKLHLELSSLFTESTLRLMNVNISILSVSNRLLRLLSITPVSLNKDSDAIELAGEDKYLLATVAKAEHFCLSSIPRVL